MIRTMVFDPSNGGLSIGDETAIDVWRNNPDTLLWIDMEDEPEASERSLLEGTLNIHPLAIDDALRRRHPPKVEYFDDFVFILMRGLSADTKDIDFGVIQLSLFIGERFIVTRRFERSISTDAIWDQVAQSPSLFDGGCGAIATAIISRVVRRFNGVLLNFEPRLDELENEIFAAPNYDLLRELTSYKSSLKQMRRFANYHLQIAGQIRGRPDRFLGEQLVHEINDIHEQLERTLSLSDLYYELGGDLVDAYLGLTTHQLNRVMQLLTIFTVVFVPLTFIAGIYGMNFDNMPELHSKNGYFYVVGVMLTIAAVQVYFFRKRRWV